MNKNLIAALVLGVEGLLLFAFVMPEYRAFRGAGQALVDRDALLAQTMAAREQVETLSREYAANERTIAQVLLALPKQKQYDYLTESFQAAAEQSSLELSSLSIAEAKKGKEDYYVIPIKAELAGSYTEFLVFLDALEHSLRLYDIIKVDITASTGGQVNSELTIALQVNAYSLK